MKLYADEMKLLGIRPVGDKEVDLRSCIADAYIAHLQSKSLETRGLISLMKGMHIMRLPVSKVRPQSKSSSGRVEDENSKKGGVYLKEEINGASSGVLAFERQQEDLVLQLESVFCRLLPSSRGEDVEEMLSLLWTLRVDVKAFEINTLLLFINKLVILIAEQQQKPQDLQQHQRKQRQLLRVFAPILNSLSHRVNDSTHELMIFETLFRFTHTHRRSQILRDLLKAKTTSAADDVANNKPISLVEVLDRKIAPAIISDLPPGYLLALLSSFRTLSVRYSDFPQSMPPLVTTLCSMAATLDGRSLLSLLRSLASFGMRWEMLTSEQQTNLAAGVARILTGGLTVSRLSSCCGALISLGGTRTHSHT